VKDTAPPESSSKLLIFININSLRQSASLF
jgi:hypothetical protein